MFGILGKLENRGTFGISGILEPWEAWGNPREPGYNVKTLRNCKLYGSWKV